MLESVLAGLGLTICLLLLAGMLLGPSRRAQLRAWWRHAWHWPRHRSAARREARKAIERARRAVEREGNVLRPKSFNGRPPDDKLH